MLLSSVQQGSGLPGLHFPVVNSLWTWRDEPLPCDVFFWGSILHRHLKPELEELQGSGLEAGWAKTVDRHSVP